LEENLEKNFAKKLRKMEFLKKRRLERESRKEKDVDEIGDNSRLSSCVDGRMSCSCALN